MKRADGQYRWLLGVGAPRFTGDRQFAGYIGSCLDITGRVQEEKRQNTENKIAQVLSREISLHDAFSEILKIICEELDWEIGLYGKKINFWLLQNKQHFSQGRLRREFHCKEPANGLKPRGRPSGKDQWIREALWIENVIQYQNSPEASRTGWASKCLWIPHLPWGRSLRNIGIFNLRSVNWTLPC
jgi:hypothetical protein